jgi:hypothetical protein
VQAGALALGGDLYRLGGGGIAPVELGERAAGIRLAVELAQRLAQTQETVRRLGVLRETAELLGEGGRRVRPVAPRIERLAQPVLRVAGKAVCAVGRNEAAQRAFRTAEIAAVLHGLLVEPVGELVLRLGRAGRQCNVCRGGGRPAGLCGLRVGGLGRRGRAAGDQLDARLAGPDDRGRSGCAGCRGGRCGCRFGGGGWSPALFDLAEAEIDVADELVEPLLDDRHAVERLLDAAREIADLPFEGGQADVGLLDEAARRHGARTRRHLLGRRRADRLHRSAAAAAAREVALHDVHVALQAVHAVDQRAEVLGLGAGRNRRCPDGGRGKRGAKGESADHEGGV